LLILRLHSNKLTPSLLKKRRRKGVTLGRHTSGRRKKWQGTQTLVATIPAARVPATSALAIDPLVGGNTTRSTAKPSDLPHIKHLLHRANYAERKCLNKTEQMFALTSDIAHKKLLTKDEELALKQTQKEFELTLKQTQSKLEKQIAKEAASAIKLQNKLEKKLSTSEASSLKVSKTLTTRAVCFTTALSNEKEKPKPSRGH